MATALEIASIPIIFVMGFIGIMLPPLFKAKLNGVEFILKIFNGGSAGVLFSAGLVHLLPDSYDVLIARYPDFPMSNAIAGAGFSLMLVIEILAHRFAPSDEMGSEFGLLLTADDNDSNQTQNPELQKQYTARRLSRVVAVLLFVALATHSVIAGLALSLSVGTASIGIFVAILAHKSFAAFSLGTSLLKTGWSKKSWKYWMIVMLFTVSTPLGIGIGITIQSETDDMVPAFLQSVASGVFLYMGCWHLLVDSLSDHGLWSCLAYCLGFGLMSMLALWS